jgi:hypothetical protein
LNWNNEGPLSVNHEVSSLGIDCWLGQGCQFEPG